MSHEPELVCDDDQRRNEVRRNPYLNGLDYLEFADQPLEPGRPVRLWVYFLDKAPAVLHIENIRITGGRRITDLKVIDLHFCRQDDPDQDDCMIVTLDKPGDLSTYTLCIVELDENRRPTGHLHPDFDPHYACLDLSFAALCASDLDCKTEPYCPPVPLEEPEIDYLAKDYASFRRLIYDRLAVVMPGWQERHVPDLGVTLVELLAYAGDYLSYYQDAVATEAYLDTARQRISVRRHVRLVDYPMHEGCNARAWVCFQPGQDVELDFPDFYLITTPRENELPGSQIYEETDLREIPYSRYEVFQPVMEPSGSLRFTTADLRAGACLLVRLREARDPLSRYLLKELPPDLRGQIEGYAGQDEAALSPALENALAAALNRFIEGPGLYERARFAQVELRSETQRLLGENPSGEALVRLNRLLLEDAYPGEIARHQPGWSGGDSDPVPLRLWAAHNRMRFYTWGDLECCLLAGSTQATLWDEWEAPTPPPEPQQYALQSGSDQAVAAGYDQTPLKKGSQPADNDCDRLRRLRHLQPGDVLIFEEVIGPTTGNPADADPTHRHAVRLTSVVSSIDRLYGQPIVEIEWAPADALPFPLCISTTSQPPDCESLVDVSVACGNVILVDHGRPVDEPLGCVPVIESQQECESDCDPAEIRRVPGKFRPQLKQSQAGDELTFSQPIPAGPLPASARLGQDPRRALPWIRLNSGPDPACRPADQPQPDGLEAPATEWTPRPDLLSSSSDDSHFVVEMDNERRAHLRFGDGDLGRHPEGWTSFGAGYRVGNGVQGNVGANTIRHLVFRRGSLSGLDLELCNPLPAQGGVDPEPLEEVKLFAPHAFRLELARAVTAEDYAAIVMRDFKDRVQRAAATLRWMGSWYEVLVAVDPRGDVQADPALLEEIAVHLEDFRLIGHDVTVGPAQYVPLEISLEVCVLPNYVRGHVKAALLDLLSNRRMRDGRLGFFHPDNLSFGAGLPLSRLLAAVQALAGVESVTAHLFKRQFEAPNQELESGFLPLGPLEVARLDNDPNLPENGKLTLTLRGGR